MKSPDSYWWFLLALMIMTLGYQQHGCLSLVLLLYLCAFSVLSLFTPWACMFPSSSPLSFFPSLPLPLPPPLFLLLLPLFPLSISPYKRLPSLRCRGWQDKKHVSIRQSRKGRIDSETKEGFTAVYDCMCVCVHVYVCVQVFLHACAPVWAVHPGLSAGRDRKWSKTWMISLPLNEAQIQPAKHCFHEIRWLKFIKTLTLQTRAKEINIFENIFSCLNYFRSAGLHFSYTLRS